MKIFSVILNILCICFTTFVVLRSDNKTEEFLFSITICSVLWSIVLFIRGVLLILSALFTPFKTEAEVKKYNKKSRECAYSLIMCITLFFVALIEASHTPQTVKGTIIALLIWAIGRSLFWVLGKKKIKKNTDLLRPTTEKACSKTLTESEDHESNAPAHSTIYTPAKCDTQKTTPLPNQNRHQAEWEWLKESIQWEENNGIYNLLFIESENFACNCSGRNVRARVRFKDADIAMRLGWKEIKQVDFIICEFELADCWIRLDIRSIVSGVLQAHQVELYPESNTPCWRNVKHGECILSIDTKNQSIISYQKDKDTAELEREKELIKERLLKQKQKRELERQVQQELVNSGQLVMEGSKRRHIPHSVVSEVYRRDGARCVICGSTENLQLDHIIPFSKGGADTAENLQVLCQKCNLEKSNKI